MLMLFQIVFPSKPEQAVSVSGHAAVLFYLIAGIVGESMVKGPLPRAMMTTLTT